VQLKARNVTPGYIKEVKAMGFREKISVETIVKLKIFKIDKAFINKATQFAGSKPSADKLIQLKIAEGDNSK
jgi:hypothetical protein